MVLIAHSPRSEAVDEAFRASFDEVFVRRRVAFKSDGDLLLGCNTELWAAVRRG